MPIPKSKAALEILLHKSITTSHGLPRAFKLQSQAWLKANGVEPLVADDDIK